MTNKIEDHNLNIRQTYNGDQRLKRSGITLDYNEEQIMEIIKCKQDIFYFIENYVKITSLDEGLVNFNLYPFQRNMIQSYLDNREVVCLTGRQMGKCVTGDTMVTVRNKKTGEIKEIEISKLMD